MSPALCLFITNELLPFAHPVFVLAINVLILLSRSLLKLAIHPLEGLFLCLLMNGGKVRGKRSFQKPAIHQDSLVHNIIPPSRGKQPQDMVLVEPVPKVTAPLKIRIDDNPQAGIIGAPGDAMVDPASPSNVEVPDEISSSGSESDSPDVVASSIPADPDPPHLPLEPTLAALVRQKENLRPASADVRFPLNSKLMPPSAKKRGGKKR